MQPTPNLKLLYWEIKNGCSESVLDGQPVFLRHLAVDDELLSEAIYEREFNRCIQSGLETEAQKLTSLNLSKEWTEAEERSLAKDRDYLSSLYKTKDKCVIKAQIPQIEETIKKTRERILSAAVKRDSLVGITCEKMATRVQDEFLALSSVFKDKQFQEPFYHKDEWEYLENADLKKIFDFRDSVLTRFDDANLKKISLLPAFFNFFSLSDKNNPASFFGGLAANLTIFQYKLLFYGKNVQSIFENVPDIPDSARNDYDSLVSISKAYYEERAGKRPSGKAMSGDKIASGEELKAMLKKSGKDTLGRKELAGG